MGLAPRPPPWPRLLSLDGSGHGPGIPSGMRVAGAAVFSGPLVRGVMPRPAGSSALRRGWPGSCYTPRAKRGERPAGFASCALAALRRTIISSSPAA
jgi:hypothetical protein